MRKLRVFLLFISVMISSIVCAQSRVSRPNVILYGSFSDNIRITNIITTKNKTEVQFSYIPFASKDDRCINGNTYIEDLSTNKKYKFLHSNIFPLCNGNHYGSSINDADSSVISFSVFFEKIPSDTAIINIVSKDNPLFNIYGIKLLDKENQKYTYLKEFNSRYLDLMDEKVIPEKEKLEEEINKEKQRGEFETTEDYEKRMKTMDIYSDEPIEKLDGIVDKNSKETLKLLIKEYENQVDWKQVKKITYEADKQSFDIEVKGLKEPIDLEVPIAKAKLFKNNIGDVEFLNPKYQYWGGRIVLSSVTVKNNEQVYPWKNQKITREKNYYPLPRYKTTLFDNIVKKNRVPTKESTPIAKNTYSETNSNQVQNKAADNKTTTKTSPNNQSERRSKLGVGLMITNGIGFSVKNNVSKNFDLQGILYLGNGAFSLLGRGILKSPFTDTQSVSPYAYGELGFLSYSNPGLSESLSGGIYGAGAGLEFSIAKVTGLSLDAGYRGASFSSSGVTVSAIGFVVNLGFHYYFK